MKKLKNIIDTWNVINRFAIQGWEQVDDYCVLIPEEEFNRMYRDSKNKAYILNLLINH